MNSSKKLKKLLSSCKTLVMPDAYDPISARLIERSGFKAVQCSGYSFSIAAAKRNEIDISRSENIEITRRIVETVKVPVMADAEDGYGSVDAVAETTNMFMKAGVAGMNIEDQILGNGEDVCIISEDEMVEKIQVARKAAETGKNTDFIINGRTDALKSIEDREEALNVAVERANLYLSSGADIAFIAYVETLEEVQTLNKEIKGPISIAAGMPYNIKNFSIGDLEALKIARISLPTLLIYSSLKALDKSLKCLKNDDMVSMDDNVLYRANDINELL